MTVNPIARILALVLTLGVAAPLAIEAQPVRKVYRIGVMEVVSVAPQPLKRSGEGLPVRISLRYQ